MSLNWEGDINPAMGSVIHGDRRSHRRHRIELDLHYKARKGLRLVSEGTGKTYDLSSRGICFTPTPGLRKGMVVELAVDWPVPGEGNQPMELLVAGRVVRSDETGVALKTRRHEIRPRGVGNSLAKPLVRTAGSASGIN